MNTPRQRRCESLHRLPTSMPSMRRWKRARSQLAAEGITSDRQRMVWSVDLRYCRQVHEVTTLVHATSPLDQAGLDRLMDDFEARYERKFGKGSAYREAGIEMTTFRLTARGLMPRPQLPVEEEGSPDPGEALIGRRPILDLAVGSMVEASIYDFTRPATFTRVGCPD